MFNVVVEIKAPEIVEVIRSLVGALVGAKAIETAPVQAPSIIPQVQQTQEQPGQIIYPQQQYPTLGYTHQQQVQVQPQPQPQPQQQVQSQQTPIAVVPTTAQTYTIDQLAVAATQLMDAGRKTELVALLTAFGVQALTMLPKEQYGNFATQLRTMGAKI